MESVIISSLAGIVGIIIGSYITFKRFKYEKSYRYFFSALDQKLKAHQEAYNLSWDLPSAAHKSEKDVSYIQECEKWYRENCLYLELEARDAFFKAYRTASNYFSYLHQWKSTKDDTELKQAWNLIISAPKIIERNVTEPLTEPTKLKSIQYDYKGKINK